MVCEFFLEGVIVLVIWVVVDWVLDVVVVEVFVLY